MHGAHNVQMARITTIMSSADFFVSTESDNSELFVRFRVIERVAVLANSVEKNHGASLTRCYENFIAKSLFLLAVSDSHNTCAGLCITFTV